MFTSSNLLIKSVTAAALVSGVAITAFVLISDGDISSEDINEIFDEALQKNTELVTELCKENLNETTEAQEFLENISDSNITVDNEQLATVVKRCEEILVSTSSTTTTTYEDEGDNEDYDNEDYDNEDYDNEDNDEYTVSVTPECDETLSKEYSNDPRD